MPPNLSSAAVVISALRVKSCTGQRPEASSEFNDVSTLGRSLYWCQALHITNKDRYQSTSARRALALLNSPQAILDIKHYLPMILFVVC